MANRIEAHNRRRNRLQMEITDLSGGFVSQAALYDVDERYLADVKNMELIQGMWQKRKGFHLSGSYEPITPTPRTNRGIYVFNKQDHNHILAVYNNILYDTYQLASQDAGKIVYNKVPGTRRVRFTDFRDDCYLAHGQGGILKFNGKSVSNIPAPAGDVLAVYDNRLVLGGIKGDPMTIYFSELGDGATWNALNYIALDGRSGEKITALIPLMGKLYIFTNRSIYSLVGTMENFAVSKEVNEAGAVSAEAIQLFRNRFYFVSDNGKIFEYDGGNFPTEISKHISHFIKSELTPSAYQNVVTTYHKDSVWFTMDNDADPERRLTLVYFPEYGAWSRYVGIPAASYFHIGDTLFFTGSHNRGSIYQYGTQYRDDIHFIEGSLTTAKWSFDALENIKRFKTLYVRGAIQGGGGNGFSLDFLVDDSRVASVRVTSDIASETEIWGRNNWGEMFWGSAPDSAGTKWGQANWKDFDWAGANVVYSPRWGPSVWGAFRWGDHKRGSLQEDVGEIYRKIYLSQYNVISGKTIQLVIRDNSPDHGFRFERLLLEYIQKGAR